MKLNLRSGSQRLHSPETTDMTRSSSSSIRFSVIIPAFNEAKNIERCLEALCAQTLSKQMFEVIVVDNGSSDGTVAAASRFLEALPLQVVSKTQARISVVRNYGAALARGEILAFLDADCIAPSTWLDLSDATAPTNALWGAHYLIPANATWIGRVWFSHQATEQAGEVSFVPAGDLFIARIDFDRIGGFAESLQTSEDVELCLRAKTFGLKVIAYPPLGVIHEGTARTLTHFYRQNRWHGTHVVRMFLKNLPSTRNLPLVALSVYILILFWITVLSAFIALPIHRPLLPIVPLVLLLLPALLLALWKSYNSGYLRDSPPLFVLYMTYLLSRAASLLHMSSRDHR